MTAKSAKPNRRRKWLIAAGAMGLLLFAGWFVLTSGPVVKALVLPRVSAALHADLTVEELRLSPFSGIELKNVTLTPVGGQPLAEIANVKVRYRLFKLLGGAIALDEVVLDRPQVTVRQRADGGSDWADWLAKFTDPAAPPADGARAATPVQVRIGQVTLRDGGARYEIARADGSRDVLAIEALEFGADQVRNGATSEFKLGANVRVETSDPSGVAVESLKASVEWSGKVALGADVTPGNVDSRLELAIDEATGRFAQSAGLSAVLKARGSVQKLDELTLSFRRGPTETGRVQVTGGYDVAAGSGTFDLNVGKLPPVVLALAAAQTGLDFEFADFSSTNHIAFSQRGRAIAATGGWLVNGLTATKNGGTTPVLDVALNYAAAFDVSAGRIAIDSLKFVARQSGQPLVEAHVSEPLHYTLSGPTAGSADGALNLEVSQLRPGDWRLFVGDLPVAGSLSAQVGIASSDTAQGLTIRARAMLSEGQISIGTNRVDQLTAALEVQGELSPTHELRFPQLSVRLAHSDNSLAELAGTAHVGLSNFSVSAQTTIKAELAPLAALAGDLPVKVSGGTATLTSTADYSTEAMNVQGTLSVAALGFDLAGVPFSPVGVEMPFELTRSREELQWTMPGASLTEGGAVALQMTSSGRLNPTNHAGTMEFALPLINERLVNPFLAVHAPQQRLRSAQASVAVKGEFSAEGRQRWSLSSQATNVVLVGSNNVPIGPALGSQALMEVERDADGGGVRLKKWEGHLFAGGQPAGELTAEGELRTAGPMARFNAKLTGVNEHMLGPLVALLSGDRRVEQADLSAETAIDYEGTRPSQVRLGLALRGVRLHDPLGRLQENPRDVELKLYANIVSNRADLAEGSFQMTPNDGLSNRVDLAGWVDLAEPTALRGDLSLRSPGVDLSPLYGLLERRDGNTNEAPDLEEIRAEAVGAEVEEFTPAWPVSRFAFGLNFQQVKLRELTVSNWLAQAIVFSNSLDLGMFSLQLNGAPVNARLHATNSAGRLRFELAAEIERLRIAPVVRTFYPDWPGLAEAEVYSAVHLQGAARAGQSLWTAASGEFHVGVTNASFQPLSRRWQNTLRPVGLLLQSPELFTSPIKWAIQHVQLTNQTLTLAKSTVVSDAYVLDTTFAVALADDFTGSAIPRTPLDLYLSRNLVTQLGLLPGADTNRVMRFVRLPAFAFIQGTIGEPRVEADRLKLTGMTLGSAGHFVGGSAGDLLQRAGGVTEALGSVVSGRTFTGGEYADAKVVRKGIEGVFRVVGGILGGSGRVVESGTSAATGTKFVVGDELQALLAAFDWPRVFTNAPNMMPTVQ